jgi:hypothetical protein
VQGSGAKKPDKRKRSGFGNTRAEKELAKAAMHSQGISKFLRLGSSDVASGSKDGDGEARGIKRSASLTELGDRLPTSGDESSDGGESCFLPTAPRCSVSRHLPRAQQNKSGVPRLVTAAGCAVLADGGFLEQPIPFVQPSTNIRQPVIAVPHHGPGAASDGGDGVGSSSGRADGGDGDAFNGPNVSFEEAIIKALLASVEHQAPPVDDAMPAADDQTQLK